MVENKHPMQPLQRSTMEVLCRHSKDDYGALMIAQGMEDAGADVFSVTTTNINGFPYVVFCKFDPEQVTPAEIDAAVENRLFPE